MKVRIQYVILWEFKNNRNATEKAKKNCSVYRQGDLDLLPSLKLVFKVLFGWFVTERSTQTRKLIRSQSTCFKRMQSTQKYSRISTQPQHIPVYILPVFGSTSFSEKNKENCILIVTHLLSRQNHLKYIITNDGKWVFYHNVPCKKQWIDKNESLQPPSKAELYRRKVMLCTWWDLLDVYFEFLNCNQTRNADLNF